jgi:hypothetical protein
VSAAKRVAHAAETIRARWERDVASDPQTEAAQALEDTCQLLDPEVAAELGRLRTQVADLLAERHSTNEALDDAVQALRANAEQALPWAHAMPDGDLHGFLDDMVSAAMGRWRSDPEVPDRVVLADIEKACADWRTPGEGYRSDPEDAPDAVTQAFVPVASLREPDGEFHGALRHSYRVSHDLPETGGAK